MQSIKLRRVGLLLAAALGLLTAQMQPAYAQDAMLIVVQGSATVATGLSYPCVGTATLNPAKCPSVAVSATTTKPVTITDGNTRAVTDFGSSECVAAGTFLGRTADPTSQCTVKEVEAGIVTGSCGLSSGLILVLITILWTSGTPLHTDTLANVHWVGIASELIITGTTKPENKRIVGVVNAVPPPGSGIPPGNSCAGKTATTFTITGAVVVASP